MTPPDKDRVRLQHMRDYAAEAVQLSQGKSRADLDTDRLYSLAMVRLVELIGEAAGRVSRVTQEGAPQIPWAAIVAARNRLIHGYDQISQDIVWSILSQDLPVLTIELNRLLNHQ